MGAIAYEDFADYLVANGLAIKSGANQSVWGQNMPSRPDFMIGVYEQSSTDPDWTMGRRVWDNLIIQTIVRDATQTTAHTRVWAIYNLMSAFNFLPVAGRTINGTVYGSILARHAPFPLGMDENNRFRWTCSYNVRRAA